ncbi:D-3-phosphoglycerate dehydrogenase [Actinidia rufa]|uniref:phosphoglycerate dehydrogenase n=1 Tax=Actinidia rufa TaxID=165716 RepID=A0A7J0D986_9ERIC|nr:D-3-phosphoglycerate dehydrogenase [Actinidia rufa]
MLVLMCRKVNACFDVQEGVSIEIAEVVFGALKGELAPTAVNAPTFLTELKPFVKLAEKLGTLAVQLIVCGSGVKILKLTYASTRAPDDLDTRLLRAMITKGLINLISNVFVKLVNANFNAKQRGLCISEERILLDGSPESPLESIQVDQPGMIGNVGSIFGDENVNVSSMSIERTGQQLQAVMTIEVDKPLCQDTLKQIGEVPAVEEFVFLKSYFIFLCNFDNVCCV